MELFVGQWYRTVTLNFMVSESNFAVTDFDRRILMGDVPTVEKMDWSSCTRAFLLVITVTFPVGFDNFGSFVKLGDLCCSNILP